MSRRAFKMIEGPGGILLRSESERRAFKRLSGSEQVIVPPLPGYVNKSVVPSAVADYEGVATAAWSTINCTTASGIYSCLTYHQTTVNQRTTAVSAIMPPVRYTVHEPSVAGATYDSTGKHDVFGGVYTDGRGHFHFGSASGDPAGKIAISKFIDAIGMINTILPVSGRGHVAVLSASSGTWGTSGVANPGGRGIEQFIHDGRHQEWNNATPIVVPELQSISPGTAWANFRYIKPKYMRHRRNGVTTGSLITLPVTTSPDPRNITFTVGDTYEFDIWWEISIIAALAAQPIAGKNAAWIPLSRVSDGSRLPPAGITSGVYSGDRYPIMIAMDGFDFNSGFDPAVYTYEFTLAGIHTWTLQNGTNTQKAATVGTWTANITRKTLSWTGPITYGATTTTVTFTMDWSWESVNLRMKFGNGGEDLYYRPQVSADYIETTTSTEFGAVTWAPRGVFNGSGTTVFLPGAGSNLSDGTVDPASPSLSVQRPTSITLIRKTI